MDFRKVDALKPFLSHGVEFEDTNGDEAIGTCPFTDKPRKFYVNMKTGLWDSKTASESGNAITFLQKKVRHNAEAMPQKRLQALADNRGLPIESFEGLGLGWDGLQYTLPIYDVKGRLVDVRRYRIGKRVVATGGMHPGLFLSEQLSDADRGLPVWVCEGEWDTIALRWLANKVDERLIAVGVSGANIFGQKWASWFQGRNVILAYDSDIAGTRGDELARRRLTGIAKSISSVHWPPSLPVGFDLRDWITRKLANPKSSWKQLRFLVGAKPRSEGETEDTKSPAVEQLEEGKVELEPASWSDVVEVFQRWLHLPNMEGVEIAMAAVISNLVEGDPVWMFLVAPPGGSKTETIVALSGIPEAVMTSSLTPNTLISGAMLPGGRDPSLIPRLHGKVLLVKDFTTILGMHDYEKEEIFGILRDAYDGKCGKEFGNGISRSYVSRFTIVAGVTPSIYEATERNRGLGERFLKYALGHNLDHAHEDEIILRAMSNVSRENTMREELQSIMNRYYASRSKGELPAVPKEMFLMLVSLAKFGARLRGTVTRDRYRNDVMTSRPSAEIGSRLGKQLVKLARSLAMVRGKEEVSLEEYQVMKKVILDTIPQREEDIVRWLFKHCSTIDEYKTTRQITAGTRYPHATTGRLLSDLFALDVVKRGGKHNSHEWTLTEYIRECVRKAGLYQAGEPKRKTLRVLFKKKRKGVRK